MYDVGLLPNLAILSASVSQSRSEGANLGDFSDFTSRWDSAHLAQLQSNWDNDNEEDETEADKIARLGSRPTSYTS